MRSTMKGTSGLRSLRPIAGAIGRPEEEYVEYLIRLYVLSYQTVIDGHKHDGHTHQSHDPSGS